MKVTIADDEFLPFSKSQSMAGDNENVHPESFQWQSAPVSEARFVTDRKIRQARGEGQVAWLCEPFFLHPENYMDAMAMNFDYVVTHNMNFARNMNWVWVPKGGSFIQKQDWQIYEKSRMISMIGNSQKNSTYGHKFRTQIAEKYGYRLDAVFGMDGRYTRKLDCLKDFKYSIVIENEMTEGFFTEKLIDCFATGTIPIYWGAPDIGDYFDTQGVLVVKSEDQISDALDFIISDDHYEITKYAIINNIHIAEQCMVAEDYMYRFHPYLFD